MEESLVWPLQKVAAMVKPGAKVQMAQSNAKDWSHHVNVQLHPRGCQTASGVSILSAGTTTGAASSPSPGASPSPSTAGSPQPEHRRRFGATLEALGSPPSSGPGGFSMKVPHTT